jgi:membrane protease YdiL (CAAX protease family)
VLAYGTIEISWGWIAFYGAALLFTGISEEGFARGIVIPALLRYGKWRAVLTAAMIISAGHITNIFFEEFDLIGWLDKFLATFSFAILYGAIFLKTGNLWPMIALHAIHDYSYLTSGTAGPFLTEAIHVRLHVAMSLLNAVYGLFVLSGTNLPLEVFEDDSPAAASGSGET